MSEEQEKFGTDKAKNLELWNSVCKTDPKVTKQVNQRGGFTAIDAQSQILAATTIWGSYGKAWGVKDCRYTHIYETNEKSTSKPIEVMLTASFYYPAGEFEIATDIAFRAGNDTCKKLLTDLTTKALSKLGFNSDIFEGKFEDSKYVESLKESFAEKISKEQITEIEKLIKDTNSDEIKLKMYILNTYRRDKVEDLTTEQGKSLVAALKIKLKQGEK